MSMNWLPGFDSANGTLTMPWWAAAAAAVLIIALLVVAVFRAGGVRAFGFLFRVAILAAIALFGWTYVNRTADRDRADERRALDQRAAALTATAIAPGSTIACLEATSGDVVEGGCERAVFTNPETLAAATTYVAARLALLSDAHDFATRRDTNYESSIAGLRRMIAADRFGLVSQVLIARDGCTADACDAFNLVYDDKTLRADLRDRPYDQLVGRYAVNWPSRVYRPVASAAPTGAPLTPPNPNLQFPSSQSIPPVSIMNNEPTTPEKPEKPPQNSATAATAPPAAAETKETKETKAPTKRARERAPASAAANNGAPTAPLSLAPAKQD